MYQAQAQDEGQVSTRFGTALTELLDEFHATLEMLTAEEGGLPKKAQSTIKTLSSNSTAILDTAPRDIEDALRAIADALKGSVAGLPSNWREKIDNRLQWALHLDRYYAA